MAVLRWPSRKGPMAETQHRAAAGLGTAPMTAGGCARIVEVLPEPLRLSLGVRSSKA